MILHVELMGQHLKIAMHETETDLRKLDVEVFDSDQMRESLYESEYTCICDCSSVFLNSCQRGIACSGG